MTAVKPQHCSCQFSWQPNTHENVTWISFHCLLMQKWKERNSWIGRVTKWSERLHALLNKASTFKRQNREIFEFTEKENKWECPRLRPAYAETSAESNSTLTECQGEGPSYQGEALLSHQFSTGISRARASYSHKLNQHTVIKREWLLGRWRDMFEPTFLTELGSFSLCYQHGTFSSPFALPFPFAQAPGAVT